MQEVGLQISKAIFQRMFQWFCDKVSHSGHSAEKPVLNLCLFKVNHAYLATITDKNCCFSVKQVHTHKKTCLSFAKCYLLRNL